jgi:hypothetical protein
VTKQVRKGLTQKQRKSRNRRIANAIHMYRIRMSPPMRRNWKKEPYGTREGEPRDIGTEETP